MSAPSPFAGLVDSPYVRKDDGVVLSAQVFRDLGVRSTVPILKYSTVFEAEEEFGTLFLGSGRQPVALGRRMYSQFSDDKGLLLSQFPHLYRLARADPFVVPDRCTRIALHHQGETPSSSGDDDSEGGETADIQGVVEETCEGRCVSLTLWHEGASHALTFEADKSLPVVCEEQFWTYAAGTEEPFRVDPRFAKKTLVERVQMMLWDLGHLYAVRGDDSQASPFSFTDAGKASFIARQVAEDMRLSVQELRDVWIAERVGSLLHSRDLSHEDGDEALLALTPDVMSRCYPLFWQCKKEMIAREVADKVVRMQAVENALNGVRARAEAGRRKTKKARR